MNINRHNYETFFLLYIDNELSVAERKAVDEFVQLNPDLREELVMLQQSILQPDPIVFDNKAGLFQNESAATNIQEKLLLYLDNELLPLENAELEAFIAKNSAVEKEWNLLQQTKLSPDSAIVFGDKGSLYRKEAGRLVAFPWRRALAAAVLIGFGVWGGMVYFNTDHKVGKNTIAVTSPVKTKNRVKPTTTKTIAALVTVDTSEKETSATQSIAKKASKVSTRQSPGKVTPERLINPDIQTIAAEEKNNNLPKPYFDNVNKIESNKTITAYVTPEKQINSIVNPGNNDKVNSTDKQDAANLYAAATSFNDNMEENDNHVLFMDEEKIKKTKLGGMLRKVKRVIERSANIKTGGNSIKVANLEFAIQ